MMGFIRKQSRTVGFAMIILMLMTALPYQTLAALIATDTVLDTDNGKEMRDQIKDFMTREDVRAIFIAQGIDQQEALARVNSLTASEVAEISYHIDQLPAGRDTIGIIIGILVIVLLVVIIVKLV